MKSIASAPILALALLVAVFAGCTHSEPPPASPTRPGKKAEPPSETPHAPTRSSVVRGPEGTEIAPTEAWIFACLECEGIPYAEMGDAIARARGLLEAQKIEPVGPCRTVYLDDPGQVDAARLRYRVGYPVAADALPTKPLLRVQMPARYTARILHRGDYDEAFQLRCYEKIPAALEKAGFTPAGAILEIYRYSPEETDVAKWVTEIRYPITKKGVPAPIGPGAEGPGAKGAEKRTKAAAEK